MWNIEENAALSKIESYEVLIKREAKKAMSLLDSERTEVLGSEYGRHEMNALESRFKGFELAKKEPLRIVQFLCGTLMVRNPTTQLVAVRTACNNVLEYVREYIMICEDMKYFENMIVICNPDGGIHPALVKYPSKELECRMLNEIEKELETQIHKLNEFIVCCWALVCLLYL